ncbi:MAG: undecaprenyldiphospho-muramoylpentapeptide beta-N-acetylglucosaminyltransferase [Lachnospiraceae bacterium]|jgi:UDP-N-acetylglucosamine--N-acetylmuramyl-(pentapeptide) pyrophosphoryl-undecaprenol N-acetylglucosamine transferase|nr:undecaprenyldiphospho-muramoylpentapeptide beta-N-acetylglucosaminyltransferase [Lachnospiraceae bacterium]
MKKIVLTGGGTAGHVTPNIALLPSLQDVGYEVSYIGSYNGIEKKLIEDAGIPYYGISSGKLRRYFDLKNFTDPFRVIKGFGEANKLIKKIKPDVVFSKGGFVAVPVVLAAAKNHIPTIIHESDMTPGLANKICIPQASRVCCNFKETFELLPKGKAVLTGTPIRKELFEGDRNKAAEFCGLSTDKPTILIIGGSSGSVVINNAVRESLDEILENFQIIHLCGKDHLDDSLKGKKGYVQFEYISKELRDLFALCDIVISRAGANAICELLALRKPNILIPLSKAASRGDQILNAKSFKKNGFSYVIEEEELSKASLLNAIRDVSDNKESYIKAMSESEMSDSIGTIMGLITELSK